MARSGFGYFDKGGRSRDGFTQNPNRVWGHCETPSRATITRECINKTMYRCDTCHEFVCANHQKQHRAACPQGGK